MAEAKGGSRSATSYKVTIGSKTFGQTEGDGLEQLVIEDHVDMVEHMSLRLAGIEGQPKWEINIGDAVEAKLGAGDVILFAGEVIALEPSWAVDGLMSMTVRCLDKAHRLARGRKTRFFENKKDSEVATTVGGECGLSVETDPTEEVHPYILQRNESNLAFLKRLAARNNFQLTVDENKLIFKKGAFSGAPTKIEMGKSLRSLRMGFNSMEQVDKVIVRGWCIREKKEIVGTASSGDIETIGGGQSGAAVSTSKFGSNIAYITDVPVGTQSQANEMAKAEINLLARQFAKGTCTVDGNDGLRAGQVVEFAGLNANHNGKFYIISTRHIISPTTGYLTELTFCSNTMGT
ncbi:MAG: contractile injection system protein, VgrG/Pvc8 family [Pseudomonadota bacterium]|nr:contractile injection system protein, VgrG/Pvc8 family [Pseudomonadota bacterium]